VNNRFDRAVAPPPALLGAGDWPAFLAAVLEAGDRAGRTQRRAVADPAAAVAAERALEAELVELIDGCFDSPAILAEEHFNSFGEYVRAPLPGGGPVFTVDPLDGTKSFVAGSPLYAVSIAVWSAGEPVYGLVYQPGPGRLYTAALGGGALVEGAALSRPAAPAPRQAAVRSGTGEDPSVRRAVAALTELGYGLESMECTALKFCLVAEGRRAGLIKVLKESAGVLCTWGTAAGQLIAAEAGVECLSLPDGPWRWAPGPVAAGDASFNAALRSAAGAPARQAGGGGHPA
jgi:fructose-1,6-bisphosphatase/inositol monophosphatase family enzyme